MKSIVSKVSKGLFLLLTAVVAIAVAMLALSVLTQIIVREAFSFTILPLDDVIPYAFSISIFAGAALLFKERGHIAITVLSDLMPSPVRRFAIVFSEIVIVAFLVFFTYYGIEFWLDGRFMYSPLLGIRLFYIYAIMPIAGLSGLIFILDNHLSPPPEETDGGTDIDKKGEASA